MHGVKRTQGIKGVSCWGLGRAGAPATELMGRAAERNGLNASTKYCRDKRGKLGKRGLEAMKKL